MEGKNCNLVSVVMPVYNAQKYLEEAIISVKTQDYPNMEIIAVNDGSTDGSLSVLKKFSKDITIINNGKNAGIGSARNDGVSIARGEYLAFMDADDIWKPEKISLQMKKIKENPLLDMVFTYSEFFASPDSPLATSYINQRKENPIPGYIAPALLIKRESFDKVGFFETRWKVGEFVAWLAKAKDLGLKIDILKEALHLRRVHKTNTVITHRSSYVDYTRVIRESLDRKRKQI